MRQCILQLSVDCLLEVFTYLSLLNLCSAANVCQRFRQNAQAHFAFSKSKYSNFATLLKRTELSCYSIVKYAPQIEILRIEFNKRIRHRNSIYFGLLRKLNTFTLNGKAMRELILASIHELVAANVRHLNLVTLDLSSFHRIEGVSKLKSVRILHLSYVKNLTFDIILGICMELIVRMELHLICNDCSDFRQFTIHCEIDRNMRETAQV